MDNTTLDDTTQEQERPGVAGASTLVLSREEATALAAPSPDHDHDVLPTGEVYVAQVHVRRRLERRTREVPRLGVVALPHGTNTGVDATRLELVSFSIETLPAPSQPVVVVTLGSIQEKLNFEDFFALKRQVEEANEEILQRLAACVGA